MSKPTHTAVGRIEVDGKTYQDGEAVALTAEQAASLEARGAATPLPKPEVARAEASPKAK